MNRVFAFSALAALLVLALLAPLGLGGAPAAAADLHGLTTATLCNQVFLPAVFNGLQAAAADASGIIAPPASPSNQKCDGSPDFNGDGYADLAIGVPNRELFDGVINQMDAGIVQVVYGGSLGLAADDTAVIEDQIWHRGLGLVANPLAGDQYGRSLAHGDFNGDGYHDLAIGIPGANIAGQGDAGAVQVIYGARTGLDITTIEEFSADSLLTPGDPGAGYQFGFALIAGDFDGNGRDDLAVSSPYADVGGDNEAGLVHVFYGGSAGLTSVGSELIHQDISGFADDTAEPLDRFGWSLAAGDFNGDGVDDLAVGTPYENNGTTVDAGSVQVFFGSTGPAPNSSGLVKSGAVTDPQHWSVDLANVEGAMEAEEAFGFALAAGNFDGDAYDDLAVGTPFETHGTGEDEIAAGGAIHVIYGSADGLAATAQKPARIWHQGITGVVLDPLENERFGWSLAAADFDNDGYADVAVGVPGDWFLAAIGSVHMLYGSSNGITAERNHPVFDLTLAQVDDAFGSAVMAGDFNGDGYIDLAVGAYLDDPAGGGAANSGSVFVLYSDTDGVVEGEGQHWYPGFNGLRSNAVSNDAFGGALSGSPLIIVP